MAKTFDDIAAEQGWNADSREQILRDFIDGGYLDLDDYALKRAFEENEATAPRLPDLQMDVTGEYYGNPYAEQREYRIRMTQSAVGIVMSVEDNGGSLIIGPIDITAELAEGIITMARTDHGLGAYRDDWTLPGGMDRQLCWGLGDGENDVRLHSTHIDEVAAWLGYATGEDEWTGGEDWEF